MEKQKVKFERKPRKFVITRKDNETYLVRWNLFQCPWFTIKVHKILASDDACLHDHPWPFMSIILKGGYIETSEINGVKIDRAYTAGNILFRKAAHKHRLTIEKPCYTFVITLKRVRQWGFWTSKGWVIWNKYEQGSNQCD